MTDINGKTLKAGQICKVHPTETSISKKPYEVSIQHSTMDAGELMTQQSHCARINEYLLKRLEIIR